MPPVTCPDRAREVFTEAPACIRCGRPTGTSSSPANLMGEKQTVGIAMARVLDVVSIVRVEEALVAALVKHLQGASAAR